KYYERYIANNGKVFLSIVFNIQYLGKIKTDYRPVIELDYNNGYVFSTNPFYGLLDNHGYYDNYYLYDLNYKFTFDPLSETVEFRCFYDIPAEVSENTDAPLRLIFRSVDGSDYTYRIR
ncbi:MAG: hypothetical protein K6D94_05340, partial [Clostridiales bacterium]|nr:hypothetical protein [Clostridiales bacterium]